MEVFFLIILAFFVRLLPRLIRPDKTDSDTWYHISSVASIYNNKFRIPNINKGFTLGGKYDYPFFAHWIVALFVNSKVIKYERFIGPIVDTIYIISSLFYFYFILSYYQISIENNMIYFLLLITFSSSMLKISTGPRIYSFTPRVFGEYFIFVFLVGFHMYILTDNAIYMFISVVFGSFALNTSTFGSQVLFLFTILLSVILNTFTPFLMFLSSIVLAIIISKGHYLNILTQQMKFTTQYATYGQFNHPSVKNRNKISQYMLFLKYLLQLKIKDAYTVFQTNLTFLNVFYKNFEVMVLLILLPWLDVYDNFLLSICIVAFLSFLITSFKPFLFLGESDRYLEYIIIFAAIILTLTLDREYIILIILVEIVFYLITLYMYKKQSNHYGKEYLDTMKFISEKIKNKNDYVIHGILYSYINYSLSVLSGIKSLAIETNYVFSLAQNKKLMLDDTLYTNDFDFLYEMYGVNLIVASKKNLNQNIIVYDFSKFDIIYENSEYIVYVRKIYD